MFFSAFSRYNSTSSDFSISCSENISRLRINGNDMTNEFKNLERQFIQNGIFASGNNQTIINGADISLLFRSEELPISISIRVSPSLDLVFKNASCKNLSNIDGINTVKIQNLDINFQTLRINSSFACYLSGYCKINIDNLTSQNIDIKSDEYSECIF